MPSKLLVIDDEPNTLYSFERCLQSEALTVLPAATAREGIALAREERPDAVVVDVRLPDMSGLDVYDQIHGTDPRLPVIVITAHGTTEIAIEAIRRGAFDYLLKPVDMHALRAVLARALDARHTDHVQPSPAPEPLGDDGADVIVGRAPSMQALYKTIGRVAARDVTVLVCGESGTGKELVARAIRHYSGRRDQPFLAINCAAIPEALLESELFGHERGSFTGAERRRIGKFEQVSGGTLFLDEIGDMTAATQAKVLRVLQEQRFERLGDNRTIETDVRVIAATNKDLSRMVQLGQFREDLFYRLAGFTIDIPPLRERLDDLPLLVDHFVRRLNRELDGCVQGVAPSAMRLLQSHAWPGNVRELQSAIRFAFVHTVGEVIVSDCLPEPLQPGNADEQRRASEDDLGVGQLVRSLLAESRPQLYRAVLARVDRVLVEEVLRHARGNQAHAAELLGISRTTLRAKLRSLGIAIEKQLLGDDTRA